MEEWFTLYQSAIRCAMQPCSETGFVFLNFENQHNNHQQCLLYLNNDYKKQVFVDPSSTANGSVDSFFTTTHILAGRRCADIGRLRAENGGTNASW